MPAIPPTSAQLVADIERRIRAGEWKPGEPIPTTRELAAAYRVGERTVQRVIRVLRDRGVLVGRPGARVYVA